MDCWEAIDEANESVDPVLFLSVDPVLSLSVKIMQNEQVKKIMRTKISKKMPMMKILAYRKFLFSTIFSVITLKHPSK